MVDRIHRPGSREKGRERGGEKERYMGRDGRDRRGVVATAQSYISAFDRVEQRATPGGANWSQIEGRWKERTISTCPLRRFRLLGDHSDHTRPCVDTVFLLGILGIFTIFPRGDIHFHVMHFPSRSRSVSASGDCGCNQGFYAGMSGSIPPMFGRGDPDIALMIYHLGVHLAFFSVWIFLLLFDFIFC